MRAPRFNEDIFGTKKAKGRSTKVKVAKSMQNQVLARQKNHCNRCKNMLDMRAVEFDHIKEVQHGGGIGHKLANIQAICRNCHGIKTNKTQVKKTIARREKKEKRSFDDDLLGDPLDLRF